MIFYVKFTNVEFTKKFIILSLLTPLPPAPLPSDFLFKISVISVAELFLRGGDNSLKQTYVWVGTYKANRNEQEEEGRQKLEVSREHTF